jgi:hypothetical protein
MHERRVTGGRRLASIQGIFFPQARSPAYAYPCREARRSDSFAVACRAGRCVCGTIDHCEPSADHRGCDRDGSTYRSPSQPSHRDVVAHRNRHPGNRDLAAHDNPHPRDRDPIADSSPDGNARPRDRNIAAHGNPHPCERVSKAHCDRRTSNLDLGTHA